MLYVIQNTEMKLNRSFLGLANTEIMAMPWEERAEGTLRKGKRRDEKKASPNILLLELMFKLNNASITWYFLENQT